MNRLDSDLMGLLLAILTFALPAVSALFEKRRKERRRRDASAHEEPARQYPDNESPFSFQEDISSPEGPEVDAMEGISRQPEEDERTREIEELFEVLLGVQKKPVADEPAIQEGGVPAVQEEETLEQVMQEESTALPGQEEPFEEGASAVEPQLLQRPATEPEAGAPAAGKSLKERLKEHPEDMVLFAEIMKPKFKEF